MKKSKIKKFETDVARTCSYIGLMVGSIVSFILDNLVIMTIGLGIGSFIGLIYNFCQKLKALKTKNLKKKNVTNSLRVTNNFKEYY